MSQQLKSYCKLTINDFNIDTLEGEGWSAPFVPWDEISEVLREAYGEDAGYNHYIEVYGQLTSHDDSTVGTIKYGPFPWSLADFLNDLPDLPNEVSE